MSASDIHVVILAAGQGTRMKSRMPKVLHRLGGKSLIEHVLGVAQAVSPKTVTIVVGHEADSIRRFVGDRPNIGWVLQEPQLGTAHALQQTESQLAAKRGTLILLSGDVPCLRLSLSIGSSTRIRTRAPRATVVTAVVERPYGYGRIVRTRGRIARIVEERDASPAVRQIREINGGIYAFDLAPLFDALRGIASQNAQGEYYLTDLVAIYRRRKLRVETLLVDNPQEIRGINSRTELAEVSRIVRQTKNEELMAAGVTIIDPATTYIEPDVQVGPDTVIHPGVAIEGQSRIGAACEIHSNVRIVDSEIADKAVIQNFCLILGSRIAESASVGPFAHLRPESVVGEGAKIGNFVELKKTTLGPGRKRTIWRISVTRRLAPRSTWEQAPSRAITTAPRSTRR
jgi:bifunctional UDP-N-acetylglucosamine pyrophosphorylase/glucosamine-1-phosphate N-acetyltransferase